MLNHSAFPLVSVLMPAYNHAPYARAAAESVLGQAYENLELIVIDDASTDETWSVLQSIKDDRLRLVKHDTNRGAHATLNEALRLARGTFIAIINSDDLFHPDRLAACVEALQTTQADLVGTDILLIDDEGQTVTDHWWNAAFTDIKHVWMETRDWPATLLEGNVFMTTSNFCFRRSWFEMVGDFHDLRYVLDYEWVLRGLTKGQRLSWLDVPLLSYRLHGHNTISERPLAANLECAEMLRQVFPLLLATDEPQRARLIHLASQWKRIEKYMGEIEATRRHEALVAKEAELFSLIHDRDRWIADRDGWIADRNRWIADRDRWIIERDAALADCQDEKAAITASLGFRVGRMLTAPARWLRTRLARKSDTA
jgi:glycosyltransferase involved in cell wall biosynthesis